MYLLNSNERVAGFAWGYLEVPEKMCLIFEEKYRQVLIKQVLSHSIFDDTFSIAEMGIMNTAQGRGWGKLLFAQLVHEANTHNAITTVWTRADTSLTPICLKSKFKQLFGPEVILNPEGKTTLTGEIILDQDPTMPERVFFISQPLPH